MNTTMVGAVLHGAKDLRLEQCAVPNLRPGEVLVRARRAGICGSDLHYFTHGHCAAFVPTRPFILGHELVGDIVALAEDVKAPRVGTRVAVNPARNCLLCGYCKSGRANLCPHTIMLGSASTRPPTDGVFAQFVAVRADQCHAIPDEMSDGLGAMMEPFAVALHALKRAGHVSGESVLVTGAGTIGLLVALAARTFGAVPVAVSDITRARREGALRLGVDAALDPTMASMPEEAFDLTKDGFGIIVEASGSPQALRQAFDLVRPGGRIVQIGTLGAEDIPLPANQLMVREVDFIGTFRYANEFEEAIRLAAAGRVNLEPLISRVLPLAEVSQAMALASARDGVLKVQLETASWRVE